jgi:hypothetical protein
MPVAYFNSFFLNISARRPDIFNESFRHLHQSLQRMPGYYLQLGPCHFLPPPFQSIIH